MFKKKPTLKPYAPLRSSDRRKIATNILKDYGLEPPVDVSGEDAALVAPVSQLRNKLFPENTSSAKFNTTLGPELSPVNGVIYSGTHQDGLESGVQRPLWVQTDDLIFPTIYTLFENPTLLPLIYTHDAVLKKLQSGADLMVPGLIGPPFNQKAIKGALVAIGDYKSPTVPLVVGIAEIDIANLTNVSGEKGKAVRILHWVNDELYHLGSPGLSIPEKLDVPEEKEQLETDGGVPLEENLQEISLEDKGKGRAENEEESKAEQEPDLPVQEIDNAFRDALIYGFHSAKNAPDRHPDLHQSLPFPLSSSYVLTELIIPHLASHHPSLQISKTSWRKMPKMLKVMDKEQLLKIKERSGEVVVYAVNWDSNKLLNFKPYPLPKPKKKAGDGPSSASTNNSSSTTKVVELFKPSSKLSPIYDAISVSARETYTGAEVSQHLISFFTADPDTSLIHPTNGRLITIDPILAHTLLDPSVSIDAQIMSKGTIPRDQLLERFRKAHNPYFQIIKGSEPPSKPSPGTPPKILIVLEKRQGNKTMTKIQGLETFGVRPPVFAEELKKLAASSTTMQKLVGSKPADNLVEVLAQGNQETVVEKLLDKYGVSKRYISVDNKLSKGKK